MYGVQATGFVDKPIEDILSEIETEQKANIAAGFDVSATSPAGQINGILSTKLREIWEVLQAVYNSLDPDAATELALTRLSSITGTVRQSATKSTVTATVNLDAGVTLPAGSIASVSGNPDARFVTIENATNSGGSPANVFVEMEAETAGAVVANTGTLTVIETATTGWNSVTNAADATIGEDLETDADLRVRRENSLRASGSGNLDAIVADVKQVSGVVTAVGVENTTLATDSDGLPGKSFEIIVLGGADDDIAQAIWDSKPAGIQAYSTSGDDGTATDVAGASQTVAFGRPTVKTIYLDVFVTINSNPLLGPIYPVDGDTQIKDALSALVQTYDIGQDFILSQLYPTILAIDGVLDVTSLEADFTASPSATSNLTIGSREIADLDTANITVTTA